MERIVRDATPSDFDSILQLNSAWVHYTSPLDASRIAALHSQAAWHRVVDVSGDVGAFLLALGPGATYDSPNYRWFDSRYADFLYIDRVVVSSACQRLGLGAALYHDAQARATACGYGCLVCEVDIDPPNPSSIAFHDRCGFIEVGTQSISDGAKRVSLRQLPLG